MICLLQLREFAQNIHEKFEESGSMDAVHALIVQQMEIIFR